MKKPFQKSTPDRSNLSGSSTKGGGFRSILNKTTFRALAAFPRCFHITTAVVLDAGRAQVALADIFFKPIGFFPQTTPGLRVDMFHDDTSLAVESTTGMRPAVKRGRLAACRRQGPHQRIRPWMVKSNHTGEGLSKPGNCPWRVYVSRSSAVSRSAKRSPRRLRCL